MRVGKLVTEANSPAGVLVEHVFRIMDDHGKKGNRYSTRMYLVEHLVIRLYHKEQTYCILVHVQTIFLNLCLIRSLERKAHYELLLANLKSFPVTKCPG